MMKRLQCFFIRIMLPGEGSGMEILMDTGKWLELAQTYQAELTACRRFLHEHAETGFELKETKNYVRTRLEEMGYTPADCGRAGLVALAGGRHPGSVFLLRADMDALPIEEETGLAYACREGRMHACGHDMHTSMLLGAARLLKEHEDEIPGTVKLMFQPAEEILEGSADMLRAGVLENPRVDAALMLHVMAGMPLLSGSVIVSSGVSAPSADMFTIHIQGKGCHGSMPQNGIDPVTAAAHVVLALQEITARELPMSTPAVLTIGGVQAGNSYNAIPDSARLMGSMRTFDEEARRLLRRRVEEIASGTAATFRAQAAVSFDSGCPTLKNDAVLSEEIAEYAKELLGSGRVFRQEEFTAAASGSAKNLSGGSEDFANVSHRVPSVMLALAAGEPEKGYHYPQHHPKVRFDENVLAVGSAVYAYLAFRWLAEHRTM